MGLVVLLGTSMALIVAQRNTDVRSRATYDATPTPTPTPTPTLDVICEAAWVAGDEEIPEACVPYFENRTEQCESAFQQGENATGCEGYIAQRKIDCRFAALNGEPAEGCSAYLTREPVTIPERICFSSPDYPGCTN